MQAEDRQRSDPVPVQEVMRHLARSGQAGLMLPGSLLAHGRAHIIHPPFVRRIGPAARLQERQGDIRQPWQLAWFKCAVLLCMLHMSLPVIKHLQKIAHLSIYLLWDTQFLQSLQSPRIFTVCNPPEIES